MFFPSRTSSYDTPRLLLLLPVSFSDEDLGEGIRSGAGNVWLRRVEGYVEDGLVELLAMRGDLLHARLVVQVPQPDRAVVACTCQSESK